MKPVDRLETLARLASGRLTEMAAPYRQKLDRLFGEGNYTVWAYPDPDKISFRLVFARGGVWWTAPDLFHEPENLGDLDPERLERAFVEMGIPGEPTHDLDPKALAAALENAGWVNLMDRTRPRKTATYFGGRRFEGGVVEPFKGTVYHGTEDLEFFETTYNSPHLGFGSHLKSLQDGDALSVTPEFDVARGFARGEYGFGMIVEFEADLNVYYAGRLEDTIDEIEYPADADAVAIPFGFYEEHEIAVVRWDGDNLKIRAVHLPDLSSTIPDTPVKGRIPSTEDPFIRIPTRHDRAVYFGAFDAYLSEYFEVLFGKGMYEVTRLLDVSNAEIEVEQFDGLYCRIPNQNPDLPVDSVVIDLNGEGKYAHPVMTVYREEDDSDPPAFTRTGELIRYLTDLEEA